MYYLYKICVCISNVDAKIASAIMPNFTSYYIIIQLRYYNDYVFKSIPCHIIFSVGSM